MTTFTVEQEEKNQEQDAGKKTSLLPGAILAKARTAKGYSIEYVASRLHLRARVIELLEADEYAQLPEAVFVKGYIRAYAKLIEEDFSPLLQSFHQHCAEEGPTERALWQSRREVSSGVHLVRWFTMISLLCVMIAVAFWWHQSKDSIPLTAQQEAKQSTLPEPLKVMKSVSLTDLNKMHTIIEMPAKGNHNG